jgi:hypothetical protein
LEEHKVLSKISLIIGLCTTVKGNDVISGPRLDVTTFGTFSAATASSCWPKHTHTRRLPGRLYSVGLRSRRELLGGVAELLFGLKLHTMKFVVQSSKRAEPLDFLFLFCQVCTHEQLALHAFLATSTGYLSQKHEFSKPVKPTEPHRFVGHFLMRMLDCYCGNLRLEFGATTLRLHCKFQSQTWF